MRLCSLGILLSTPQRIEPSVFLKGSGNKFGEMYFTDSIERCGLQNVVFNDRFATEHFARSPSRSTVKNKRNTNLFVIVANWHALPPSDVA